MELIPNLPEEIGLECLTRMSYMTHRVASGVCRRWRDTVSSREFYHQRRKEGKTSKLACLLYSVPDGSKEPGSANFGIAVFDPVSSSWEKLSFPKYPNGFPLLCQFSSAEGKIVVFGGWDPVSYELVRSVFVYDFTTRAWKRGQDMPSKKQQSVSSPPVEVLKTNWEYDARENQWNESTQTSDNQGFTMGDDNWRVSGYCTEKPTKCPANWAELDGRVRFGSCAVELGELTLVTGSAYNGAAQGFFLVDTKKGNQKLEPIDVPQEFSGFVQSGCCVEI